MFNMVNQTTVQAMKELINMSHYDEFRYDEHGRKRPVQASLEKEWDDYFGTADKDCPAHYDKDIQPWDYMESIMSEEAFKGYLWGNVIKYMSRWEDKGGKADLAKASDYIDKMLETL